MNLLPTTGMDNAAINQNPPIRANPPVIGGTMSMDTVVVY